MNDTCLQNKVVLITGGSTGIGAATAELFARRGARVIIASRRSSPAEDVVARIRGGGGHAIWHRTDVSRPDQVSELIATIIERYGRLDCAFNNGGSGGEGALLADIKEDAWHTTIDGYLSSVYYCMKHQIREMLKSGGGAIVNNASVDGLRGSADDPAYAAAKHGVVGLTKSAALQYARLDLRVNAICPGWIDTPLTEQWLKSSSGTKEAVLQRQPIGRLGTSAEVAETVVWLCSGAASLVTGIAMPVDGAYTAV